MKQQPFLFNYEKSGLNVATLVVNKKGADRSPPLFVF